MDEELECRKTNFSIKIEFYRLHKYGRTLQDEEMLDNNKQQITKKSKEKEEETHA